MCVGGGFAHRLFQFQEQGEEQDEEHRRGLGHGVPSGKRWRRKKKPLQLKKQQKIQRKPRLSSSSKVSKPYRGLATDSQANGDEEEAPVGESDVQGGCQGWERQRGRLCLGSSIPGIRLSRLTGNRLTVRQDLKICRCDINGQFLRAFQRSHMRPTVTMETLHVCMKQAV